MQDKQRERKPGTGQRGHTCSSGTSRGKAGVVGTAARENSGENRHRHHPWPLFPATAIEAAYQKSAGEGHLFSSGANQQRTAFDSAFESPQRWVPKTVALPVSSSRRG